MDQLLNTNEVTDFATRFLGLFIEAGAFLLLGSLVSGLIAVFVTNDDLARVMPKNPILATFAGVFLGFAFPVCECGVVPVTRRLYQKGLPVNVGITFLLAAPVMNPIVLASTYAAFGFGPVLIGRYLITAIIALAVGLLFSLERRGHRLINPQALGAFAGASPRFTQDQTASGRVGLLSGLYRALKVAGDDFYDVGRYLIIGCILAAAMQTFVNQEALRQVANHPVNSVFTLAALSFIMSLCSTTDALIALSFASPITGNGFTLGAILVFLTFGPMVDIKSILMYLGIFRRRTVLYMAILPLLISLLIGIWLNLNVRF